MKMMKSYILCRVMSLLGRRKGMASVRMTTISNDNTITPAIRRSINKARREYANGETISCSTPEEMQRYFDSL